MPKVLHIRSVINNEAGWGDAVRVDRATRWGNPYVINELCNREQVCQSYRVWLEAWIKDREEIVMGKGKFSNKWVIEHLDQLKGKDLVCWCAPLECHGDTLLKLANL